MGLKDKFDKAKDKGQEMAREHGDKIDKGIDRGKDFMDEKTGGKYSEQMEKGADKAREGVKKFKKK